ncbi:MAG: transposase [Planctomycetaceae bacterium]|nr:transposase [Planctomycetaceae bacterium]
MLGNLFDPNDKLLVHDRLRPHWAQSGAIVFITARTRDSIPKEVLLRWESEKIQWFEQLACKLGKQLPQDRHWSNLLVQFEECHQREFLKHFDRCREMELDKCHGECLLRNNELARIVADSLLHFDKSRYRMGDFVIMPNHFHALVAFCDAESMEKQISSWLHWTATQINRRTGRDGHFWQQEPFDHLVRSVEQYKYLRKYIHENPKKAGLVEGQFIYRRLDE